MPPSTKTRTSFGRFELRLTTSGGKNTGAAVLARTSCHSGNRKLQSSRFSSLYLAKGFVLTGQGESVVTFLVTTSSRHLSRFVERSAGRRGFLPSWNIFFSVLAKGSSSYKLETR